jgi:Meckel syndrome type 1 protein
MSEPGERDPRLDAAYRETPREEPAAALDARIRAAAHRAIDAHLESPRAQARRSWASRWRLPLSVAATALIAVTLSVMVQEERGFESRIDAPVSAPALQRAPAPPEAEAKRRDEAPATLEKRQAPATSSETAAPPTRPERSQRKDNLEPHNAGEGDRQSIPVAPAPAAAPMLREERSRPGTSDEVAPQISRDRGLADRPLGAAREQPAPAAAAAPLRTPERWLEDIRQLQVQGRNDEAAAELAELRRRYPDFVIPANFGR